MLVGESPPRSAHRMCTSPTGVLGTLRPVEGRDSKQLRGAGWGETLERVRDGKAAVAVIQRGRPEAVLLSIAQWRRGTAAVPVPESNIQTAGIRAVRDALRAHREDARRGRHTLITWHGNPEPEAVMAPYAWTLEALPELGEIAVDDSAQQRYRGEGTVGAGA